MKIDARLPVRFGPLSSRREDEAVLADIGAVQAGHGAGCTCCTPHSAAAAALAALFRARAVGTGPAFRGVLATTDAEGEAAVRAALAEDALVSGRFRLAPD